MTIYFSEQQLEETLAILFDGLPNLKSSSVIHKSGVGSGIQIGSRDITDTLSEYVERVRAATVSLRLKSKIHYEVIFKWYRTNSHDSYSDYKTGVGYENFHKIRKEALDLLASYLNGDLEGVETDNCDIDEEISAKYLESGDLIEITGGSPFLRGTVAYFDKYIDQFKSRLLCYYFKNGNREICIINTDQIRTIESKTMN